MTGEKQTPATAVMERQVQDARNTEQDEAAMAEVGKVQQFKRNFGEARNLTTDSEVHLLKLTSQVSGRSWV